MGAKSPTLRHMSNVIPIKPNHLPQFVGYAEVGAALGVSRRTVERMVREGKFPMAVQLTPNRVGWKVETVTAWLEDRSKGLVAHAVAHPEDLKPEQLEDQARDLSAQALSKRTGMPVDPANLSLQLTQQLTADEFHALEIKEHQFRIAFLRHLPPDDAAVVVAFLMPQLRSTLLSSNDSDIHEAVSDAKELPVHFRIVSDFLRLFELETRLLENGLTVPSGKSVLDHLAGLDAERATIVAAWMFPAMRPFIVVADGKGDDQRIFPNATELGERAMAALCDNRWAEWMASYQDKAQDRESGPDQNRKA